MLELLEQDGEELCQAPQRQYLTSCGESFETLDQCVLAAEAMTLGDVAECSASHTVWAEGTSDYTMNGFYLGAVSALRKQRSHHSAQVCPIDSPQMIQVSAALIAALNAETGLPKRIHGQSLDRSLKAVVFRTTPTSWTVRWKVRMSEERRMRRMRLWASSCVETIVERTEWR